MDSYPLLLFMYMGLLHRIPPIPHNLDRTVMGVYGALEGYYGGEMKEIERRNVRGFPGTCLSKDIPPPRESYRPPSPNQKDKQPQR